MTCGARTQQENQVSHFFLSLTAFSLRARGSDIIKVSPEAFENDVFLSCQSGSWHPDLLSIQSEDCAT